MEVKNNVSFKGMIRVNGSLEACSAELTRRAQTKSAAIVVVRENDGILLFGKDFLKCLKDHFGIEYPLELVNTSLKGAKKLTAKNPKKYLPFTEGVPMLMRHDFVGFNEKVSAYFEKMQKTGKDALGKAIKVINA